MLICLYIACHGKKKNTQNNLDCKLIEKSTVFFLSQLMLHSFPNVSRFFLVLEDEVEMQAPVCLARATLVFFVLHVHAVGNDLNLEIGC